MAPQVRFPILRTMHIADLCIISAVVLHIVSAARENRPIIRFGPATILAILLMIMGMLSLYMGPLQSSAEWNGYIDGLMKNSLVLILVEAMAYDVKRVWAVVATIMISTLWWLKAGFRLGVMGATYAGSRIMGPSVSMVQNPNGFAYLMCVTMPVYLFFFSGAKNAKIKWMYVAMLLLSVYSVLNTGSRTGILTLATFAILGSPRFGRRHLISFSALVLGIIVVIGLVDPGNIERFKTIGPAFRAFVAGTEEIDLTQMSQDESSAFDRSMKNKDTWRLIKDYPAFGVGISADQNLYVGDYPNASGVTHCEILMAGRQMGVPGMAIYAGFIVIIMISSLVVKSRMQNIWPEISTMGWMLQVMGGIFIVGGFFGTDPWNAYLLIIAATASSLMVVTKNYSPDTRAVI
ncbi:MAG: O-antigen ligase family protein [Kiritimatiellia bacterium]